MCDILVIPHQKKDVKSFMFEKWNREGKEKRESDEALMWRMLLYKVWERALFGNCPAKIKKSFKFSLWRMWTLKRHSILKAFNIKTVAINTKSSLTVSTQADSGCPTDWQASMQSSHNSYINYMLPLQSPLIPMHLSINASIILIENDLSCNETSY